MKFSFTRLAFLALVFLIHNNIFAQCPVGASVNFSADTVVFGNPTTLSDSTTGMVAGVDSMIWDVNNDGTIDFNTPGNHTFTYPSAGTFTCVQTVFDTAGCSTTVTKSVLVNNCSVTATVNFFADTVVLGNPTTFIDSTSGFVAGLDSMRWDVNNDGTIDFSTTGNQTFTYPTTGTFTCVLTVFDTLGCTTSISKSVLVNACTLNATPNFFADTVVVGSPTTFTDSTINFVAGLDSIRWDVNNDGTVDFSSTGNQTFTYPSAGTFTCVLTVFDTLGCSVSVTKSVLVNNCSVTANVNFFADTVLVGNPTTFIDSTSGFVAGLDSMRWDVNNDGTIDFSTTGNQTFTYPTAGTYTCVLTVFDTLGCTTSVTKSVLVNNCSVSATVDFFADTVTVGSPTTFIDSTSGFVAGLDSMRWDVNNDGTIDFSTTGNQTFTYPAAGTFTCVLTVFDTLGCSNSVSKSILVNPLPTCSVAATVNFFADTVVVGTPTSFTDSTIGFVAGLDSMRWDVNNDGTIDFSTTGNQTFTYPAAGTYTCVLTVFDTLGCSTSVTKSVLVNPLPGACVVAGFSTSSASLCQNSNVQINNTSTSATGATFYWDFDSDGFVDDSTSTNPIVSYAQIGTYTIQLTAIAGACTSVATLAVTVSVNTLDVNAGVDKSVVCGTSTSLAAASNQTGITYSWSPANLIANPFVAGITVTPTDTTDFIVTATKNGCQAKDTVRVIVLPLTVTAGNDKQIACGSSVTLNATTNNNSGAIYSWSPATGLNNAGIASPIAAPITPTPYIVTVLKGTCVASDTVLVSISGLSANAGPDKTITCGGSVTLNGIGISGSTYLWTPSTAVSNTIVSNPIVNPSQNITYTYTVTKGACNASDSVNVVVNPFGISAGSDKYIVCGNSVTIGVTSSVTGLTYSWSPQTTLNNPFIAAPIATPSTTTPYVITVTKAACTSRDTVIVNVDQSLPINFTASSIFHSGYPPYNVTFTNQTANINNYTYLWDFGDGTTSTLKNPSHQYFIYGPHTVKLSAFSNSGLCSDSLVKTDYIFFADPNGINTINPDNFVSVFPNPSSDIVNIAVNTEVFKNNYSIKLYNALGEQIANVNALGKNTYQLNVADFAKGIYFIRISDSENSVTKNLVVE